MKVFPYPKSTDLSYNRLAAVPNDSFLSLSNLTYLDLSYNKLEHLSPQSVRSLGHLRTLNISGNINMDLYEIKTTFEVSSSNMPTIANTLLYCIETAFDAVPPTSSVFESTRLHS